MRCKNNVFAFVLLAALFAPVGSHAAEQPKNLAQIDRCLNGRDVLSRIWSCTAQLNGGPIKNEDAAQYHLSRAYSFMALGWNDAALSDFAKTLELAPQTTEVYQARIAIYRSRRDYAKASDDISHIIAQSPQAPLLYVQRASLLEFQGQHDKAISDATTALSIAESYEPISDLYLQRAHIYEMAGLYTPALADISTALARNGDQARGQFAKGRLLYFRGDWTGAERELRAALAQGNTSSAPWLYLAQTRLGTNATQIELPPLSGVADLWPRTILSVLTGEKSFGDVLPSSFLLNQDAAFSAKAKICQLSYFEGEYLLARGMNSDAERYFREAVQTGLTETLEARVSQGRIEQLTSGQGLN